MTDRRTLFTGAPDAPKPSTAEDPMAHMAMKHAASTSENRGAVPDVTVMTHEGKSMKLYSDLIQDRVVTINFMSIAHESQFPVSRRLSEVAGLLGDRLGRDAFMISITTDPDNDTVEALAAFHRQMGGHAGWTFARVPKQAAALVAQRFYRHGRDVAAGGRIDIIQYGNAKAGLWGAFPWDIQPRDAAERVTWVMPQAVPQGEPRRAGPRRLADAGQSWNNRHV